MTSTVVVTSKPRADTAQNQSPNEIVKVVGAPSEPDPIASVMALRPIWGMHAATQEAIWDLRNQALWLVHANSYSPPKETCVWTNERNAEAHISRSMVVPKIGAKGSGSDEASCSRLRCQQQETK